MCLSCITCFTALRNGGGDVLFVPPRVLLATRGAVAEVGAGCSAGSWICGRARKGDESGVREGEARYGGAESGRRGAQSGGDIRHNDTQLRQSALASVDDHM